MAIGTAALASISDKFWWIDPAGAILISCYIIFSWGMISKSQVTLAWTGSAAPEPRSCCLFSSGLRNSVCALVVAAPALYSQLTDM